MFTPRQVTMGNKIFKVHVKYGSSSYEIQLSQDNSIFQLKEKIQSRFDIEPEKQVLSCNGRLLEVEDSKTIKQARIPNGSKILCTAIKSDLKRTSSRSENIASDPVHETLDKIESAAKQFETKLGDIVKLLNDSDKGAKLESKKLGEQLMQLLESLDCVQCTEQHHRTRRKELATKLNNILDRNDRVESELT